MSTRAAVLSLRGGDSSTQVPTGLKVLRIAEDEPQRWGKSRVRGH